MFDGVFSKILIASHSEIAIRVMRAANELGKKTVVVFAEEDKLSRHRFKADEAYRIGEGLKPAEAYRPLLKSSVWQS
jgi:pyruvate carboxylase